MEHLPKILIFLFILAACIYVFLYVFHRKLKSLEKKLFSEFNSRTNCIPALFEVSQSFLTKHSEIFSESLRLKKREFSLYENSPKILEVIELEGKIHHEINFIFKVCNKHPKLLKDGNFIYLREIFIDKSHDIGKTLWFYKTMCRKFNTIIRIKNYTIIGFLIPIRKKEII